jgi:hypothetical protein
MQHQPRAAAGAPAAPAPAPPAAITPAATAATAAAVLAPAVDPIGDLYVLQSDVEPLVAACLDAADNLLYVLTPDDDED